MNSFNFSSVFNSFNFLSFSSLLLLLILVFVLLLFVSSSLLLFSLELLLFSKLTSSKERFSQYFTKNKKLKFKIAFKILMSRRLFFTLSLVK